MRMSRRDLLKLGAASAACACLPGRTFASDVFRRLLPDDSDRVLVLLQLSGGNDGLSTVVPFADDVYQRSRKATRIDAKDVLRLDDHVGLHPNLKGLKALWDGGKLAVIQGAGYPNPNRSHFESMDIWHSADPEGRSAGTGWIGRFADTVPDEGFDANSIIHVGGQLPYSLHAKKHHAIGFQTPEAYRWIGTGDQVKALEMAASRSTGHAGRDSALDRIRGTLQEAQKSSTVVREAAAKYRAKAEYPRNALAGSLNTIAALLAGGLKTRVFSVETGGFDTHVNQKATHDNLMTQLSASVSAFMADLEAQKLSDRVLVLAFSEFGRRLAENGSGGTDHGVAGPMFVVGAKVNGGLFGKHPSLTGLDKGDLKHTTDFRSAYATAIDRWLGGRHETVLGGRFQPVEFLKA